MLTITREALVVNVNINNRLADNMPRIREPLPGEVGRALDRMNLQTFAGFRFRGYFDVHRAYDRSSGNFKAWGWKLTVGYGESPDRSREFMATLTLAIDDRFMQYEQSSLDRFAP